MSLVAFLKGVNVGGHRSLRPKMLASDLADLGVVSVGTAGTFVVLNRVGAGTLRAAIARRVPFAVDVMICQGRDVLQLATSELFEGQEAKPDIVQFVGVLDRSPSPRPTVPHIIPSEGDWRVRVLGFEGRFVVGLHRREMKAIRYLGELEKVMGTPMTVRTWSTILKTAEVVRSRGSP